MELVGRLASDAQKMLDGKVTIIRYDCGRAVRELEGADEERVLRVKKTGDGYELVTGNFK